MDDFSDIFYRDFVLRQPSKPAPVAASTTSSTGFSSSNKTRSGWNPTSTSDPLLGERGAGISDDYVFVGVSDLSNSSSHGQSASSSSAAFDPIFDGFSDSSAKPFSPLPVYDKPVYDDDIFNGVPGTKRSSSDKYEDVFASVLSGSNHISTPPYEDVLENLGKQMPESKGTSATRSKEILKQNFSDVDTLIPGFGGSISTNTREVQEPKLQKTDASSTTSTNEAENPFDVLESVSTSTYLSSVLFSDPLENISRPTNLGSMHSSSNRIFNDGYDFDGGSKPVPSSTAETNEKQNDKTFPDAFQNKSPTDHGSGMESPEWSSTDVFVNIMAQVKPTKATDLHTPVGGYGLHNSNMYETNTVGDQSPNTSKHVETREDIWLIVSEIPLYTQPTIAPPPSRAPPPLIIKPGHFDVVDGKRNNNDYFHHTTQSDPCNGNSVKRSPIDELDDFTFSKPQTYAWHHEEISNTKEELEKKTAAEAAMKETMDTTEAKFKHAKEVRERERDSNNFRNNEFVQQERNEKDLDSRDDRETLERQIQERMQKEREDKEAKRIEKERELEAEKERERARQATERAIREARERAAAEARQKAEKTSAEARQRAERAAVQRAAAEARERAALLARERAERAAAEAREKAAAEAKERAVAEARERAEKAAAEAREIAAAEAREKAAAARERAAAEAREKAASEARERVAVERAATEARLRAQRAAVERAAAEARERAAAAAREKAAAAAREKAASAAREKAAAAAAADTAREEQKREENDLESFFGMGTRATSAPKQRGSSSDTTFDFKAHNKGVSAASGTSSGSSSTTRKASTINIVDDLSSIFGVTSSAGDFQDVEGESEERRRARLERYQRAQERAAKALAEKNERDMQVQREQAERHRLAETLDFEVKRWSAGKEGNLRALLSTLQYVLWPGSGWQPVSLTDLITAAAVKKVYRKATLCIHPDKVQQKGATLQQKYIAEKVFDLLKEAWNKFNSEELF